MADYSFLLNYLQPKDKILLYGMGKNGNEILRFLQETGEFEIVGAVDERAGELSHSEIAVYPPEYLNTFPNAGYDKLILTIGDQDIGMEVYCRLIERYGVEKRKIVAVFMRTMYTGQICPLTLEQFSNDYSTTKSELNKFVKNGYRQIVYFGPIVSQLKLKENDILGQRLRSYAPRLPPEESIVLSYILYNAKRFDPQLLENILQAAVQIEDPLLTDFLYGVFVDTSMIPFMHEEYYFPAFYNIRRRLLKKICIAYGLTCADSQKRPSEKIKKICIVTETLYGPGGSPTLVCIQISKILTAYGYNVKIIPLDARNNLERIPLLQPIYMERDMASRQYEVYHKNVFPKEVLIDYPEETDTIQSRLQSQLDKICIYSPDLILDMSDEYSIPSYLYTRCFTTLYILIRGYVSSSFFSYLMVRDESITRKQNEYYQSPVATKQYLKTDCLTCISPPVPQKSYSRYNFSCTQSDFLFITVGIRLHVELTKEFIDAVCQKLFIMPCMKWFVVGTNNDYLRKMCERYPNNIISIPYEDDLPALYKICDAYLNPPRMGGGTSISWAMHYGLPVVMSSAPSDKSALASTGGLIYNSLEEMADCLIMLRTDSKFHMQCRETSKKAAVELAQKQPEVLLKLIAQIEENNKLSILS